MVSPKGEKIAKATLEMRVTLYFSRQLVHDF